MLELSFDECEFFDDEDGRFIVIPSATYQLEHSLLSVSKWESKYKKPFLSTDDKSVSEVLDYISMMCVGVVIPDESLQNLSTDQLKMIDDYIKDSHTATWINDDNNKPSRDIITSELIYYWMISHQIPFSCETWNLNRLIMLIRVCSEKSKPPTKRSRSDIYASNRALNEQRKRMYNNHG